MSFAVVNSRVRGDEGIGVKLEGRRGEEGRRRRERAGRGEQEGEGRGLGEELEFLSQLTKSGSLMKK